MKLYSIHGGNIEDLNNRKYNIGVGISLGNKYFTVENIAGLVQWALEYTKDGVIIYVADSIHAINIEVRNKMVFEKALLKANKMGDKVLEDAANYFSNNLPPTDFKKLRFVKWQEIVDGEYKKKTNYLYNFSKKNPAFKTDVLSVVRALVSKETRKFTEADIIRLGDYVIEEMPELLNRTNVNGIVCDAYCYPTGGTFSSFIDKIQAGEIYPEIKQNIIDTEPKVFLEVR